MEIWGYPQLVIQLVQLMIHLVQLMILTLIIQPQLVLKTAPAVHQCLTTTRAILESEVANH